MKGNGLVEGMLNVIDTLTSQSIIVTGVSDFFGQVIFHSDVNFQGRPTFNSDTAGTAVIEKGDTSVSVTFDKEYESLPIVNTSISLTFDSKNKTQAEIKAQDDLEQRVLNGDIRYIITKKTTRGFTIKLNQATVQDLEFSWSAVAVKNGKTTMSDGTVTGEQTTPTPSDSPTPTP